MADVPHIPALRFGAEYESLQTAEVLDHRTGAPLARVSQVNAGVIKRDLGGAAAAAATLRALPVARLVEIAADAGELFLEGTLPLNESGDEQSAQDHVEALSATSGLPHTLVRANMKKIHTVLTGMAGILAGLTRDMDFEVLDRGFGDQGGRDVSFTPTTDALGVVLPSNSPGVNSIWMPSFALKTPVMLKPGREEPWTPLRIVAALVAAGAPREAFGFYPSDHEGAAALLAGAGRSQLFGDESTTAPWAGDRRVELHGPGRSKVLIGEDEIDRFEEHLDVLVASVADNGGRSCINASTILVPRRADELAEALAARLAELEPRAPEDPEARLAAFANPAQADFCDRTVEQAVQAGEARDVSASLRGGPRRVEAFDGAYVLPTIVRCASLASSVARTEFLFPFASVVEVPAAELAASLGPSLVVSAITHAPALIKQLLASTEIDRLNLGPLPTSRVEWDQPHEGNLFEHLWERRAIQRAEDW